MAIYERRDDTYCGSCGHFTRHYIWWDGRRARNAPNGRFLPLSLGHCAHPRMKDRREDQSCPCGSRALPARTRRTQTRRTADAARRCFISDSPASAAGPGTPPAGRTTAPPAPRSGVEEPQPHGVEALALKPGHGLFVSVDGIPQDGVADIGHVDPDLMGAARLQTALHVRTAGEPLQHGPVGHRAPAARHHRHLLPVRRVAADGGVHRAAVLPEIPRHDAPVDPGQGVVLELGGELLVGEVVFGGDKEAGGVPVDPVDDAGPQLPADAGQAVPAVVEQGVHQGAVRVAGGRVDHQPLGLVHHDDVSVLVHHVQGDVLGAPRPPAPGPAG